MDMGFGRAHAEEALLQNGGSLAAAMDWILTHPPSSSPQSQSQVNIHVHYEHGELIDSLANSFLTEFFEIHMCTVNHIPHVLYVT